MTQNHLYLLVIKQMVCFGIVLAIKELRKLILALVLNKLNLLMVKSYTAQN